MLRRSVSALGALTSDLLCPFVGPKKLSPYGDGVTHLAIYRGRSAYNQFMDQGQQQKSPPAKELTIDEAIAQSTLDELRIAVKQAHGTLAVMQAEMAKLNLLSKARLEDAKRPLLVLQGEYTVDEVKGFTNLLRSLSCKGIVVTIPPGNSITTLDDNDLRALGLVRLGMGQA
jgi:hypothetical protein